MKKIAARREKAMKTPQDETSSWKETMFKELADEFVEILKIKPISGGFRDFLKQLELVSSNRLAILDLGCGVGRLFPHLSEVGTMVIGVDYSEKLTTEANQIACTLPNVSVLLYDMRKIGALFPDSSFDLVIRAYTSLGYFSVEEETGILSQCAKLVNPGGQLIIDTFNADWFRNKRDSFKRISPVGSFELEEEYNWDSGKHSISCVWRYKKQNGSQEEISFDLDGYDIHRIDNMLVETGWSRERLFKDFIPSGEVDDSTKTERLVVIAKRNI